MIWYILKLLAIIVPVGFTMGWILYPYYRRWRLRRYWREKARNVVWLLPPEDRQ